MEYIVAWSFTYTLVSAQFLRNVPIERYLHLSTATVEPRLSGPPLSGTSIIRLGSFFLSDLENGRVPQMRMRVAVVTMETCLLIFCACADNHVALLFINKVGGSRRGLSIRLSGIFTYPACFWNQGVRIIEVLLYTQICGNLLSKLEALYVFLQFYSCEMFENRKITNV